MNTFCIPLTMHDDIVRFRDVERLTRLIIVVHVKHVFNQKRKRKVLTIDLFENKRDTLIHRNDLL